MEKIKKARVWCERPRADRSERLTREGRHGPGGWHSLTPLLRSKLKSQAAAVAAMHCWEGTHLKVLDGAESIERGYDLVLELRDHANDLGLRCGQDQRVLEGEGGGGRECMCVREKKERKSE